MTDANYWLESWAVALKHWNARNRLHYFGKDIMFSQVGFRSHRTLVPDSEWAGGFS
jgi:hypothetical protein